MHGYVKKQYLPLSWFQWDTGIELLPRTLGSCFEFWMTLIDIQHIDHSNSDLAKLAWEWASDQPDIDETVKTEVLCHIRQETIGKTITWVIHYFSAILHPLLCLCELGIFQMTNDYYNNMNIHLYIALWMLLSCLKYFIFLMMFCSIIWCLN